MGNTNNTTTITRADRLTTDMRLTGRPFQPTVWAVGTTDTGLISVSVNDGGMVSCIGHFKPTDTFETSLV